MPKSYILKESDKALLADAAALLKKILLSEKLRPAELVSVAKLQHVLSAVPRVTADVEVTVSVISPRHKFGEIETWHYWDIGIEGEEISISSGGHYYDPRTGGDSFTTMQWVAAPEEPAELDDYHAHLSIVPDVKSFRQGTRDIDFVSEEFKIKIRDSQTASALADSFLHSNADQEDECMIDVNRCLSKFVKHFSTGSLSAST
jgi:hypothetical protein